MKVMDSSNIIKQGLNWIRKAPELKRNQELCLGAKIFPLTLRMMVAL